MKHFFILGNNPTLSIAEISNLFPNNTTGEILGTEVFLLEEDINSKDLIKKIGGTIKLGKIVNEINNVNNLKKELLKTIKELRIKNSELRDGKFKFGISYYGKGKIDTRKIGISIKKELKESGVSCRFVESREKTLSSVVVTQNKLIEKGIEFVLIKEGSQILIGQTEAVQPFKELSYRDYGRPGRDDQSGMIPPKLAQIMINLTKTPLITKEGQGVVLLDPFCGSGTILQEAVLIGYKNLIGSDISQKATKDSEKNINWLKSKFQISNFKFQIHTISATQISKTIEPKSIDTIVTEPYLGPQRGWHDIKKTILELNDLYSKSLSEFKKILKDDGTIVMIWPQFQDRSGNHQSPWKFLSPNITGFKIINPIPKYLQNNQTINLTSKNTIVYGRPGQKIFREIIVLKKA